MQAGHPSGARGRGRWRRAVLAIGFVAGIAGALALASPAAAMVVSFDNAKPGKFWWGSGKPLRYKFEIAGKQRRDVRVEVIHAKSGDMKRAWRKNGVPPGKRVGVRWSATLRNDNPAPQGRYRFRVREIGRGVADRRRPAKVRATKIRHHRFPMRGQVGWGDGWGAGRGHRGQDLFAPCGRAIRSVRAGRVVWKGYQAGGAGHYVVIRGRKSKFDYVYMHLRSKVLVREGQNVKTYERIGSEGATGNATGCHLHFELWRKKWFDGGRALPSVTKRLRKWRSWE